ncbi:hypothetical protein J7I44_13400 [Frateuria sp. MAH-13]|uniref:Uncharacterized protein n=1 Tax=Frateuria flava TaxID=2821489 RepID=A0ABS4DQG3_9GAMM|nr:hypothetical protein [Frateuria flava]MBP1475304.1 hypothetical protein [Frateuria flava]
MRKTLLAAVMGAGVFAILPALAQVSLGGAGRVGAGVTAGANGALTGAPGRLGTQAGQTMQRADRHARHVTDQTRRTLDRHDRVEVDTTARGSAGVRAGDQHTAANAGIHAGAAVDTGAATARARGTARGVGGPVSDRAHAAVDSTQRTAGSVGEAARRTATGTSTGADAKVSGRADTHGH